MLLSLVIGLALSLNFYSLFFSGMGMERGRDDILWAGISIIILVIGVLVSTLISYKLIINKVGFK
jgi:hypothetical protein